ncbi:hypothetical protein [Actinomadura alba]|uniref:hypothetical protein n=1 Tax=Actinomadura alba TaxID=406431 RepID=UPI001C9BC0AB|nr:hypothetical protein [Actinomadura alba]
MDLEALRHMHTPADYRDLAADQGVGADVLRHLAQCPYSFVWQVLATNPSTPVDVLGELCSKRDSPWNDGRLLLLIAEHPKADRAVLLGVLGEVEARLRTSVSRPFAAVLALAGRPELTPEEVQGLAALPGASARMRRGLRHRLAERNTAVR